jgi:hypothetical protein
MMHRYTKLLFIIVLTPLIIRAAAQTNHPIVELKNRDTVSPFIKGKALGAGFLVGAAVHTSVCQQPGDLGLLPGLLWLTTPVMGFLFFANAYHEVEVLLKYRRCDYKAIAAVYASMGALESRTEYESAIKKPTGKRHNDIRRTYNLLLQQRVERQYFFVGFTLASLLGMPLGNAGCSLLDQLGIIEMPCFAIKKCETVCKYI